jgi:hypothetical protein
VSLDTVSVDAVVTVAPVFVDAVLAATAAAIDVSIPPITPVAVDVVTDAGTAAVDVTAPPGAVAVEAVLDDPVEVVDAVAESGDPVSVDVGIGGEGGPTGMNGEAGSATPISPGTVAYLGIGWSIVEAKVQAQQLLAGTVTDFGASLSADLGGGDVVVTLRKNGAATPLTVTLTNAALSAYVSGGTVAFAKGDVRSVEVNVSATVPAGVIVNASWRLVPT